MNPPLASQIFLRAMVYRLTVTALVRDKDAFPAITLCPRICWAMEIEELERVEVFNTKTGTHFLTCVLFGADEQVQVSRAYSAFICPGDEIIVSAYASRAADDTDEKIATVVRATGNRPLEIRRLLARTVRRDPSYIPLSPRLETVSAGGEFAGSAVMDWSV